MAAKKVGGGKTPPKSTSKKPAAKKPLTAYQKAIKVPDRSKDKKLKPYDAKWKAEVKRKNDKYNKSVIHRYVEPGSQIFGRMAVIASLAEAVSGRDLNTPANVRKKKNRAVALGEAALAATPFKGARTVIRAVRNQPKNKPKTNVVTKTGVKTERQGNRMFKGYVDNQVNAEIKKYYAAQKKAQSKAAQSKTKKK